MSSPNDSQFSQLQVQQRMDLLTSGEARGQLPVRFGRYVLTELLGIGGMGAVYRGEDTALQRPVALKIPCGSYSEKTLKRLLGEARAAAKICHPNVCSIYDISSDAGQPYFTMEYIAGPSLDELTGPGQPMPALQAAKIVLKIAAGLHAAHQQGVIHRDLKPANILMRTNTDPVISDFGLALFRDQLNTEATPVRLVGSPAYMSPEQVRCEISKISPATDVYGLGAITYELITGRRPFDGQIPAIYSQVLKQTPIRPSQIVAGLNPKLDKVCLRALSKTPEDRFQTVVEFANAISEFLSSPEPIRTSLTPQAAPRLVKRIEQPAVVEKFQRTQSPLNRPTNNSRIRHRFPSRRSKVVTRKWGKSLSRQRTGIIAFCLAACVIIMLSNMSIGYWVRSVLEQSDSASLLTNDSTIESPATPSNPDVADRIVDPEPTDSPPEASLASELNSTDRPGNDDELGMASANNESTRMRPIVEKGVSTRRVELRFSNEAELKFAVVSIDGARVNAAELLAPINMAVGEHELTIATPNTKFLRHAFQVGDSNSLSTIEVPLKRRTGTFQFRIVRLQINDKVTIDSNPVMLKELTEPISLEVGRHVLEITREDQSPKRKTFWVVPGEMPDLNIMIRSDNNHNRTPGVALDEPGTLFDSRNVTNLPVNAGERRADNFMGMQMQWCPNPNAPKEETEYDPANPTGGFWIGHFEVTQAQWTLIREATQWRSLSPEAPNSRGIANSMTWQEAAEFASQVTAIERELGRIDSTWEYVLPTQEQLKIGATGDTAIKRRDGKALEWCRNARFQDNTAASEFTETSRVGMRLVLAPCNDR